MLLNLLENYTEVEDLVPDLKSLIIKFTQNIWKPYVCQRHFWASDKYHRLVGEQTFKHIIPLQTGKEYIMKCFKVYWSREYFYFYMCTVMLPCDNWVGFGELGRNLIDLGKWDRVKIHFHIRDLQIHMTNKAYIEIQLLDVGKGNG